MKKYKMLYRSNDRLIENFRRELRELISCNELESNKLESSWSSEAFEKLITILQVDPVSFHRSWVQPLLDEGVPMDVAVACIAQSYLQPN